MPQTFSSLKEGNKLVELDGWKELAWEFNSIPFYIFFMPSNPMAIPDSSFGCTFIK
jgi:hypothetical protein